MTEIKNLIQKVQDLEQENQDLKLDNDFLQKQNNALKLRCSKYCLQVRDLESQLADMKFTKEYLGVPMSNADIAEDIAIANGEAHYERFAFIGDDF